MFCFFLVLLLQVNSTIFQCTWKKCRVIHKTVEEIEDHVREAHLGYVQLNFRTHNSSYHIGNKKFHSIVHVVANFSNLLNQQQHQQLHSNSNNTIQKENRN